MIQTHGLKCVAMTVQAQQFGRFLANELQASETKSR
jgi:hypothetical protein